MTKKMLGSALNIANVCVYIDIPNYDILQKLAIMLNDLTGILATILSGAVFKYTSYSVMQNVLLLHISILTHLIRRGKEKKYIYIYIYEVRRRIPLYSSLVHRQGAGLSALTHNAVLTWYMPGILTAGLKEHLHFHEINIHFLQSFL